MSAADKYPILRLAIVSDLGMPVYDHDFHPATAGRRVSTDMTPYLQQLILHGSLDNVEDQKWASKDGIASTYLKNVDRFNKMLVSALVAPSNSTILVLHSEGKPSDDAIKHFLFDVSDLYMKVLLNPLHDPDDKIKPHDRVPFHQAVLAAARKNHVV